MSEFNEELPVLIEDIEQVEFEIIELQDQSESIKLQIEDHDDGERVHSQGWRARARHAQRCANTDLNRLRAKLKSMRRRFELEKKSTRNTNTELRLEALKKHIETLSEQHRGKAARLHNSIQTKEAENKAILDWARREIPERIEEIYAAQVSAREIQI